nr:MAG TPA: Protein of unknown function (DUF551) [Caudoviricetes sp.]
MNAEQFKYVKQDIFGKYCMIPMYANGEKHMFKCIGAFQSNTYMDVPICPHHEMKQHHKECNSLDGLEWVVNVIHCGIDETKVIRVALKDIEIIDDKPKVGEWIPFKLDEDGHFKNIPYNGQIVLVSDGTSVWHDTFVNKGDGKFYFTFTYIDLDKLAWMPLPKPYKGD